MHIPRWATREDGNKRRYTSFIIEVGATTAVYARRYIRILGLSPCHGNRCMHQHMTGMSAAATVRQMRWPPQLLDGDGRSKEDIQNSGGFTIS